MTYNTNKSLFSFFSTHMRHTLCLLFLSLLATSCRQKDKSVTPKCEGYFVSVFNAGVTETRNILCLTNAENNNGFEHAVSISDSWGELNWRNRKYYHIRRNRTETEFRYVNLDVLMDNKMGTYLLADTSNPSPVSNSLICNSLSDILYCFTTQNASCKLYEVSRNGIFDVHFIGAYDSFCINRGAVIDEVSGNIFAICGNKLKKIDPNTGNVSEVATYTNLNPSYLFYNDNDKMFYALDRTNQLLLLRINPADGILNVQGTIEGMDTFNYHLTAFDHCNNQIINLRYQNPQSIFYLDAYWINLKDASIASSIPNIWSGNVIGYINGKFPKK